MKLTIRHRIVGGFALVTMAMLLMGVLSLSSLSTIGDQSHSLNTFALPAGEQSGAMLRHLSDEQLAVITGFNATEIGNAQAQQQQVDHSSEQLEAALATLGQLTAAMPAQQQLLGQFKTDYTKYRRLIDQVLAQRMNVLTASGALEARHEQFEIQLEDASALLMDLIDLEYSEVAQERQLAANANALDSSLSGITTIAEELALSQELGFVDTLETELSYLISNVRFMRSALNQYQGDAFDDSQRNEVDEALGAVLAELEGDTNLFNQHRSRLNMQIAAQASLHAAGQTMISLQQQLDQLNGEVMRLSNQLGEEAKDTIDNSQRRTLIIMVVAVLVALFVGAVTIRAITQPLDQVNRALAVLAKGDLTQALSYHRDDEFGHLVTNTNTLVDSLRGLIQIIMERANQLAAAAEETSAVTSQTTTGIESQRQQLDQVASATTQLSASASQVATGANDALGEMKLADDEAKQVQQLSVDNGQTIQALADEVERAGQVINKLQDDSASIGGILDVIRAIADQTNLLALNAAIEAARAGEQGRGFAVVADEVRSLASRTQDSTTEIQQMIEALQQGAQEAVTVMEQGRHQAHQSVIKTQEANLTLDSIANAIDRVYSAGNQIAQAAHEQDQVSEEISRKLEQIAGIAQETSTGATQTASSSLEVAKMAEELQEQVAEFKI